MRCLDGHLWLSQRMYWAYYPRIGDDITSRFTTHSAIEATESVQLSWMQSCGFLSHVPVCLWLVSLVGLGHSRWRPKARYGVTLSLSDARLPPQRDSCGGPFRSHGPDRKPLRT